MTQALPEGYVTEVEACREQAVAEGWVDALSSTAATLTVGIAVLLTRVEALPDPQVVQTVKQAIVSALGLS